MATKKKFTPEEIKNLKANPYTLRVTEDTISYTLAFKEAFWDLSVQGYTGTAAFRKLGYNTEILGFERIHNTSKRLRQAGKSVEGFREGNPGGIRIKSEQKQQTDFAGTQSNETAKRKWGDTKEPPPAIPAYCNLAPETVYIEHLYLILTPH